MASDFVKDQDTVKKQKISIRHLKNELRLTKLEHDEATQNLYDLYSNLEQKVKERTEELCEARKSLEEKNIELEAAMETINIHNFQLEEMLKKRTNELIKTERFAAFSLLSQGIVHNLKNPLTVILSNIQMIQFLQPDDANASSDKIPKFLETVSKSSAAISRACISMTDMVNNLMTKGRTDKSDDIELVELNALLQREIDFLNADLRFKRNTKREVDLKKNMLYTKAVPGELSQVFHNLVTNALDAMYNQKDALLKISTNENDAFIWFSIKDNGPGIPLENQKKIFDPFFTTKPKANDNGKEPTGTGLGLHICAQMVQEYNGRIEITSSPGNGTEFSVYLPKVSESPKKSVLIP